MVSLLITRILWIILMFNVDNASIFSQTRNVCVVPAGVLNPNPAVDLPKDSYFISYRKYANGLTYQTLNVMEKAER